MERIPIPYFNETKEMDRIYDDKKEKKLIPKSEIAVKTNH